MSQVVETSLPHGAGEPQEITSGVHVAAKPHAEAAAARTPEFMLPVDAARAAELAGARGDAVVHVDAFSPLLRGRLLEAIEQACDRTLEAIGAPPPGLYAFGSDDARVRDWLYRARRAGRAGLTLIVPSLRPLVGTHRALATDDSDALVLLAAVGRERPLSLVLDSRDRELGAFRDPVALGSLFAPPVSAPLALVAPALAPETPVAAAQAADASADAPDEPVAAKAEPEGDEHTFLPVARGPEAPAARIHQRTPTTPPRESAWRAHAASLAAARGPQPLAEFERLFTEHYAPLVTAIEEGLDEPRARAAREEFRHTFARSYAEAFPTFVVTGKRPKLVLDAPELAARAARLHGARSAQLVLVDGLRWDLGVLLRETLLVGLGPRATLAEESFLLAALPSTTPRQLAGLARGIDGLRAPTVDDGSGDGEALRGRTAEVVRRVRVGGRDMFKLDVVEARLREADGHAAALFPEIVRRAAAAILRHAATMPPRTLLYVFGDHGFTLDASGAAYQGGASPEEVLVPAFAFLLGMVQ